jgi:hypothetical protein
MGLFRRVNLVKPTASSELAALSVKTPFDL